MSNSNITRKDFLVKFWRYYSYIEKDLIRLSRFIDLNEENFKVFSDEIHRQLITIGVEFENISRNLCDFNNIDLPKRANIKNFKSWFPEGIQTVEVILIFSQKEISFFPYKEQEEKLSWWDSYNSIKHNRNYNYKNIFLEDLLNALAALFYAEMFFIKKIGEKNNDIDVPDVYSKLFIIKGWKTKHSTSQIGTPSATKEDIDQLFK